MSSDNLQLLISALQRQAPAVITAGEGLSHREVMVQFAEPPGENDPGFWVAVHEGDAVNIEQLVESGKPVGVWFQSDHSMMCFQTVLLKLRKQPFSSHKTLLLQWPEKVSIVEERHQPRRWVPESFHIHARIQALTPNRQVAGEAKARIWDIGLEGASLICSAERFLLALDKDAWLKLILRVGDDPRELSFPATYRHLSRLSEEKIRMGIQFIPSGDPSAAAAHEALNALIHQLDQSATTDKKSAA